MRKSKLQVGTRKAPAVTTVKSPLQVVQRRIDKDPKFARAISRAVHNGLPESEHGAFYDVYENNGLYDLGVPTMMISDTMTWSQYLRSCEEDIAKMIINGENPRIAELGLKKRVAPPPKSPGKPATKPVVRDTVEVTAKEGDAFRAISRLLCEDAKWELEEKGGALRVLAGGKEVARAEYQRGTKNAAWKSIADQLEVLL